VTNLYTETGILNGKFTSLNISTDYYDVMNSINYNYNTGFIHWTNCWQ